MNVQDVSSQPISWLIRKKGILAALQRQGILTVGEFAALSREQLKQTSGLRGRKVREYHAQANAFIQDKPVWIESPDLDKLPAGLFVDVRVDTTSRSQEPWAWCCYAPDQQPLVILLNPINDQEQLVTLNGGRALVVTDVRAGWRMLATEVSALGRPLYCWGGYVRRHLKDSASSEARALLTEFLVNLRRRVQKAVAMPTQLDTLSAVASCLGYEWDDDRMLHEAYTSYLHWLADDHPELLQSACNYTLQYAAAAAHIWQWLRENAP